MASCPNVTLNVIEVSYSGSYALKWWGDMQVGQLANASVTHTMLVYGSAVVCYHLLVIEVVSLTVRKHLACLSLLFNECSLIAYSPDKKMRLRSTRYCRVTGIRKIL